MLIRSGFGLFCATIITRLFLVLALGVLALRAAEPVNGRLPSPVHAPEVTTSSPTDPPGYRERLIATARRYAELYYNADHTAALAEARIGLAAAEQAGNKRDRAQFLKAAGYVSWLLSESAAAVEYEQTLLQLAEELDDDRLRSIAHRVLGALAQQTGDLAQRREHTDAALTFADRAHDPDLRNGALNNLANLALADRDFAKARRIHEEVLAYREKTGNRWDAAGSLTNLADVAQAEHDLPRALALQERGLALRVEVGDQRGQVRSLRQVAGVLRQLGRTDEALARLKDALGRTGKITGHELLADIWREFALTHEARREFADALGAERRAAAEREAFAGESTRKRIAELQTRYAHVRQQQTISQLEADRHLRDAELRAAEAELARSSEQRYGLLAVIALGLAAAASLVSRHRLKLRTERRVLDETRAAKEAAEEADRIKTHFLGVASHDIRGPLRHIAHLAEQLRTAAPDPRLDAIARESQLVLRLVQDLTDTAALDSGHLELARAPVDVGDILRGVVSQSRWQADEKHQALTYTELPPGTGLVHGDADRLHQIFSNLVTNAIKFSPLGRPVTISLGRELGRVVVRVRDQGPGLSAADVARVFTPFARLSAQPTGGETSHGLGLSIAHELVRLHGGTLRVDSQPGRGAEFVVTLLAV